MNLPVVGNNLLRVESCFGKMSVDASGSRFSKVPNLFGSEKPFVKLGCTYPKSSVIARFDAWKGLCF